MTGLRYTWRTFAGELTMLAIAAIWWIPFYFLIVMALKPSQEIFDPPTALPSRVEWGNFQHAWKGAGSVSLADGLKSSAIITVFSVLCLIVLGSLSAYTLARRTGRLSTLLYFLFVLGIILPFQLGIVPTYVVMRQLGLTGSYLGLIVLYTGLLLPLTVFLYTGFVRTLPKDYEEAAQIDGAGLWRTYRRVVFPLLRPITGTVAILTGLIVWNDFFLPLIFLSGTSKATTPVAIYSFVGEFATQWNFIFAAVIVAVAPILAFYIFAQRQLIHGFTGGIKS